MLESPKGSVTLDLKAMESLFSRVPLGTINKNRPVAQIR